MRLIKLILLTISLTFSLNLVGKTKTKFKKEQRISFDAADIDGVARNPNASYLMQKRGINFLPMYKVRDKFDESIKSSVDYLR
ncbi:MAG: hypothetical protein AB8E15_06840 [Bdellovibrionales bacterium]